MRGLGAITVVCALAFVACGSDDDAQRVTDVITEAATVDDPAHCTELLTPAFVEQSESGDDPVAACEQSEAEGGEAADSVEVSKVEVEGDSATAEVAITGGPSDGQTLALELVKDGDDWKLDWITSFVEFDRDAFLAAVAAEFAEDPNLAPGLADCTIDAFDALTDAEIEELLLSGDDEGTAALVADACPEVYRGLVLAELEQAFAGMDPAIRSCVITALESLPGERFVDLTLNFDEAVMQQFVNARCVGS